jgi:hypothetical protein
MTSKSYFIAYMIVGILSIQGCRSTSICSKIEQANRATSNCGICGCFELVRIGGGFVGGIFDAKSQGLYNAIIIRADSILDYYNNDTLLWSHKFRIYTRPLKRTQIELTVIDFGWGQNPVFSLEGRDTIVIFNEGWIDDSPQIFIREY